MLKGFHRNILPGIGLITGLIAGPLLCSTNGVTQTAPSGSGAPMPPPSGAQGAGQAARPGRGPANGVPTVGMPGVHDPSTVVRFHRQYYVYTTGRGAPFITSPDGETWTRQGSAFEKIPEDVRAAVPKNNGTDVWAPDILRVGDQFYLYYAVSFWGSFQSAVALMTNPVLDPKDPAYKWTDRGVVVSSDGVENLNAIDPGAILAPDGTLWLCYGSYHGTIDLVQLDPKTGLRISPKSPVSIIATGSEASDIIYHDGYYYLFVNHGSCCKGKDSEYNIRVGRAKAVTGPYLDRRGDSLMKAPGVMFLAAHDHRIGPGHFGRLLDYDDPKPDGAERFSIHYEADVAHGGRSVLDIRPLLWSVDGWPVAGDNLSDGTYQIVSRAGENTLEEHVPVTARPVAVGTATGAVATPAAPAEMPGPPMLHMARYLTLDNQKWAITPVAGGFYKIVNAGTGDSIGNAPGGPGAGAGTVELTAFTGADGQMWGLEQFPDGSYRVRNKSSGLSLVTSGPSGVTLGEFVRDDDRLWTITTP